jgi:GxxExxY protein
MDFDALSNRVIGCAIEVHRVLGPGLLESTYQRCLAHELECSNIAFAVEHPVPVNYKGVCLDCGYRVDLLIGEKLIVELKSVEHLQRVHEAQLLTYMKLAGIRTGLLTSFNVAQLRNGLKRYVL